MDTLLLAVDPAGCGWEVAGKTVPLAKRLDARVVLIHAVRVPSGVSPEAVMHGDFEGRTPTDVLLEAARSELEDIAQMFRGNDVDATVDVRFGEPVSTVLDACREYGPAMLVTGTHGRRGLSRMVLGSVAEQLIRQSSCPVLTMRSLAPEDHPGPSGAQEAVASEADG